MRARIILLLLFTCLFPAFAFAAIFTVTSNADSGPGTLREALTLAAANGSAEKDYINFNLPDLSEAGRTINIYSSLPLITSDIAIDGSSQPGTAFSANGTKVIINGSGGSPGGIIQCFTFKDVNDFEVYGFIIKNFYGRINDYGGFDDGSAISMSGRSDHVIIGGVNRGNVLYDNAGNLDGGYNYDDNYINRLEIKSNYIGIKENGVDWQQSYVYEIYFSFTYNLILGGDTKAEGNVINSMFTFSPNLPGAALTQDVNIKVKNNIFGANALQAKDPNKLASEKQQQRNYVSFAVDADLSTTFNSDIDVSDNVFGFALSIAGFKNLNLKIQGNFFGTSTDKKNDLSIATGALFLRWLEGTVLIGGDDLQRGNTFTNCVLGDLAAQRENDFVVNVERSNTVELSHNSFYCNRNPPFLYLYTGPNGKAIEATVDQLDAATVSGKTKPHARVELFYTDKECTNCQPKRYFATVTANSAGNWSYNGALETGYGVMVSATLNKVSSEFTDTRVYILENVVITPVNCNTLGSISALTTVNAKKIEWLNSNNEVVGHELTLTGVPVGKYRLKAEQFGCVVYSYEYEIYDTSPTVNDTYKSITQPSCGRGGSIKGLYLNYTNSFAWLDAQGNVVNSTDLEPDDLPPGSYTLQITGPEGCVKTYGPIVLTDVDGPSINEANKTITSSPCATSTGSITGITATGTNVKFSWKNEQQQEVSTSADLTNQPPGRYVLTITDDSQCGPVSTPPIVIPAINDIFINTNNKVVQNATCSNADGSITGIEVAGSGTLTYTWTNEFGQTAGTTKQLPAAVAGTYTLTVTAGNCLPVVSQPIEIFSIGGVTLNTNNISGQAATSCAPGFIKGLQSPNATSVSWKRLADGAVVSTTFDLVNAVSGQYELTLSNATCSRTWPFTIDQLPATVFPDFPATYTKSCFSFGTGSISINTDNAASLPSEYIWRNERGERVGYDKKVEFLPAGKYKLYLRDITGCESFYKEYTVDTYPEFKVGFGSYDNIYCGVGKGKINAATVTGGTGNYVYEWFDGDGNLLSGQTQSSLNNLEPGNYKLRITDGGCGLAELTYPIIATTQDINAPVADDLKLCGSGTAVISVKDPYPTASYRLYDSPASALAISEQIGGKFNATVTESRSYFISLVYGNCESDRTEVKVVIGSIAGTIPNTFTPNGDGVNDYWALKGFENYPNGTVRIFNRAGQMVFQSTGYPKPFDGTWRGTALPAGSYYYIIDLKSCNMISGSVTLIR